MVHVTALTRLWSHFICHYAGISFLHRLAQLGLCLLNLAVQSVELRLLRLNSCCLLLSIQVARDRALESWKHRLHHHLTVLNLLLQLLCRYLVVVNQRHHLLERKRVQVHIEQGRRVLSHVLKVSLLNRV